MNNKLKTLYNINSESLVKYTNKVYKVKDDQNKEYCLKYVDNLTSNNLIDKIETLKLTDCFIMPIKTCIRSPLGNIDNQYFYLTDWISNETSESKDLKIKYYLLQLGKLHALTSYTLNVTVSYFNEIALRLEEDIAEVYQKYEHLVYIIERKEYKSPFEWYFIEHFKDLVASLDNSKTHVNKFKELVKDKSTIRQVIIQQNFSYDHIFISKNKIIANDKMTLASPIMDLKSLFERIDYGDIDISFMLEEYFKNMRLDDYEIEWLLAILYIPLDLKITSNDFTNLTSLMKILFRYKCIQEISSKITKNS